MLERMEVMDDTKDLLAISDLIEGQRYTKIALVTGVRSGLTRMNEGFYSFDVRDKNGISCVARLFSVSEFLNAGGYANSLRNKLVEMTFIAQIFQGRWSFIVQNIAECSDVSNIDPKPFRGNITVDYTELKNSIQSLGLSIDLTDWATASFSDIDRGTIGAFMYLACSVFERLKSLGKHPGVNTESLLISFAWAFDTWFKYLKKKENSGVISPTDTLMLIKFCDSGTQHLSQHLNIVDCAMTLTGINSPHCLEAHLLKKAVDEVQTSISLIRVNQILPVGSSTMGGDGYEITRY